MAEEERLASGGRSQQRDDVQISCGWKVSASSRVGYPAMRLEGGHLEEQVTELGQRGGVDGSQLRGSRHQRLGWLVEVRNSKVSYVRCMIGRNEKKFDYIDQPRCQTLLLSVYEDLAMVEELFEWKATWGRLEIKVQMVGMVSLDLNT
ncbi:hypothetical protein CFC21_051639 [Triticum aestivum]|uniref:Uncharacterized protein n=3 Tax=Triticum TaxID=4564 RepID=A0A9R0S9G8_TRITD|nr:hypothetical protein CFC21_051639 [Triticum aestivum]VAH88907.1 unnamed protein product [Triticum turgidum subsp. durum]